VDLATIRVFVAVAQSGGFSPGAKAVGLTRSAAGKALARIEDRLGTRLLHRTTRSIALTAEGQTFYERCRQILADLEEAEAETASRQQALRLCDWVGLGAAALLVTTKVRLYHLPLISTHSPSRAFRLT